MKLVRSIHQNNIISIPVIHCEQGLSISQPFSSTPRPQNPVVRTKILHQHDSFVFKRIQTTRPAKNDGNISAGRSGKILVKRYVRGVLTKEERRMGFRMKCRYAENRNKMGW